MDTFEQKLSNHEEKYNNTKNPFIDEFYTSI